MKKSVQKILRRTLSVFMSLLMLMTAWVFVAPTTAVAADVWDGNYTDSSGFQNNRITSARGLVYFLNQVANGNTYSGQTITLTVDVDLNGRDLYDAIPYYTTGFEGTFDGGGRTISNFRFTHDNHRIAMFRTAKNATFKNVTVTDVFVDDWDNNNKKNGFAIFVGYGEGNLTFENVHISGGYIYGYNYVGGLVGEYGANDILTLTNCSNSALIYADHDRAGGMVGHSKGRVYATGCSNTGEIYAGYSDAGGIAGWIEDDESYFVNCSNTGKVSTDACAGGIMGYFGSKSNDNKMTLSGCVNEGQIESRAKVGGGIAGMLDTDAEHSIENNVNRGSVYGRDDAGGIVGSNIGKGIWRNNKNYGSVRCDNDNAGGILGDVEDDQNKFYNCYNTGEITGKNSIGGIFGYGQNANHEFYDCGNSGAITSTNDAAGGIFGYGNESEPIIEQCWNIGTVKAYNDAGGILGRTYHHSYIRRCWNAGSIETYNHNDNGAHGGIAGQTSDLSGSSNDNPNMTDCFNWGPVSGGRDDGGLIGKIKDGRTPYYITNSYNAGQVTGTRPFAIIAYGGNVGNNVYYLSGVSMGDTQGTAISASDLRNSSGFSGNYCKNTWGVKIGSTTYYYPILNWYRNMFMFHLKFVDVPSGTNVYWDGEYNSAFYAPNPTRRGYTTDHWFLSTDAGKTIAIPTEIVTCGVTPCTDGLLMTQHTDDITTIDNTSVFNLTWEKIKQKLDMNAVLNDEYKFDNIDFFTADIYVNGVKVADDVNDFYDDLYFEDTYEITDIKVADGYRFVGAYTGEHEGRQQSGLTGQMDIDLIEVAPEFKTLHTVTVTPGTGTTISGVEAGTYAYGDTVTITAAAETGYDQTAPVLKVNGSVAASGSTITITGDTTITTENLTLNTYTLNFYNGDNEHPYDTQTYTHGDAFTAPADPTYSDGTDADYEFVGWAAAAYPDEGWDVEVDFPETVTASANYYSLYDGFVTVTWKNGDETLAGPTRTMVGTVPAYTGEMPTTADAQYTYTAIGWNTDPNATTALDPMPALGTSNTIYYAVYDKNDEAHRTVNKYTITWKNWDGTLLATDEVAYGTTPVYSGPAPTREDDAQYHYTTYSWDPMIATVSGPATYTAQFDYVINTYTITWIDGDGNTLGTDPFSYGETPSYYGPTPTKTATAQYTYAFNNTWSPAIVSVTGDATYAAQFDSSERSYTITWLNDDDSVIDTTTVEYGVVPTHANAAKAATAEYTYTFAGWTPSVAAVTGDATYKATFTPVTRSYTVKFFDLDGETVLDTQSVAYGSAAEAPTLPEKAPDDTNHYTVTWDTAFDNITADTDVTAVAAPTPHNLSAAWTWADDASTATVTITCAGCDYSETKNVTPTVKSSTNATCTQDGTITYTAAYAGFTAPDKTVAGEPAHHTLGEQIPAAASTKCTETGTVAYYECTVCHLTFSDAEGQNRITDLSDGTVGPHNYNGEAAVVAPSYDPTTGGSTPGSRTWTCQNEATHDKQIESIAGANYAAYQTVYNAIGALPDNDELTDTVKEAIAALEAQLEEISLNYTDSDADQAELDTAVDTLQTAIDNLKNDLYETDGVTIKESALKHYAVTFTAAGSPVAEYSKVKGVSVDVPTVPAELDGCAFLGWAIDGSIVIAPGTATWTVTGEAAFTATYDEAPATCTVTFYAKDGETVLSTQTVAYGGAAEAPALPDPTFDDEHHYTYAWSSDAYINVTSDLSITVVETSALHTWVDGEVILAATCMATGKQAQSCTCGATKEKILLVDSTNHTGHNTVTRANEVPATCTTPGSYDEVVTCECGAVLSSTPKTTPTTAHSFTNYVYNNDATCTADGTETATCDHCTATDTRTKAGTKLGHDWGEWTVTSEATCQAEGVETRVCQNDPSHTQTRAIPKLSHIDANGDNVCDNCGTTLDTGFRCSLCSKNDRIQASNQLEIVKVFYHIIHFIVHTFQSLRFFTKPAFDVIS